LAVRRFLSGFRLRRPRVLEGVAGFTLSAAEGCGGRDATCDHQKNERCL